MPLRLESTWEPLAYPYQRHEQPSQLSRLGLESEAEEALLRALRRYVNKEIRGRSLLVAGHRGAGKTTAVHGAIARCIRESSRNGRPLLVTIHGPDLLRATECPPKRQRSGDETPDPKCSSENFARHARRQIVQSLLRALCDEAATCYEDKAAVAVSASGINLERDEQAAQFRMELDLEPDELRLREYWELVDGLPRGIFSDPEPSSTGLIVKERYQGFREIVALATVLRVRREIRQHEESEQEGKEQRKESGRTPTEAESLSLLSQLLSKGSHLLNPLAGLAVGVALIAVLIKSDVDLLVALPIALFAAVAATFLLNFASVKDQHFNLMATPHSASLNLMLPVILKRVRAANLHPIFVVDELDKVEDDLAGLMAQLMNSLKHIVADQAFFCFVVSREYFEQTANQRKTKPYPAAETYFGDLMFVHHTPAQIHTYLDSVLQEQHPSIDGVRDKALIIYIALYRSKMHAGRLIRYLNSNLDKAGNIAIQDPPLSMVRAYQHQILIQIAVEVMLNDSEIKERLRNSPNHTMQVYDALYYPAREWDKEEIQLNFSRTLFTNYLESRTETTERRYTEPDIRLLLESTRRVAYYLTRPEELRRALFVELRKVWNEDAIHQIAEQPQTADLKRVLASDGGGEKRLRRLVPSDKAELLTLCDALEAYDGIGNWEALLQQDGAGDLFYWRFDRYGRPLEADVIRPQLNETRVALESAILAIQTLEEMVRTATFGVYGMHNLALEFKLLPDSWDWAEFQKLGDLFLKRLGDEKAEQLAKYAQELRDWGDIIRTGLRLAWYRGHFQISSGKIVGASALRKGLEQGLPNLTHFSDRAERLKALATELESVKSALSPLQQLADQRAIRGEGKDFEQWLPALRSLVIDGGIWNVHDVPPKKD